MRRAEIETRVVVAVQIRGEFQGSKLPPDDHELINEFLHWLLAEGIYALYTPVSRPGTYYGLFDPDDGERALTWLTAHNRADLGNSG